MRRAHQRDEGRAREAGLRDVQHQIDCGGRRFRRERQRVRDAKRDARAREHLGREIQVRQRPLEYDGHAVDRPGFASVTRHGNQLLLAVATHEDERVGPDVGNLQDGPRRR